MQLLLVTFVSNTLMWIFIKIINLKFFFMICNVGEGFQASHIFWLRAFRIFSKFFNE